MRGNLGRLRLAIQLSVTLSLWIAVGGQRDPPEDAACPSRPVFLEADAPNCQYCALRVNAAGGCDGTAVCVLDDVPSASFLGVWPFADGSGASVADIGPVDVPLVTSSNIVWSVQDSTTAASTGVSRRGLRATQISSVAYYNVTEPPRSLGQIVDTSIIPGTTDPRAIGFSIWFTDMGFTNAHPDKRYFSLSETTISNQWLMLAREDTGLPGSRNLDELEVRLAMNGGDKVIQIDLSWVDAGVSKTHHMACRAPAQTPGDVQCYFNGALVYTEPGWLGFDWPGAADTLGTLWLFNEPTYGVFERGIPNLTIHALSIYGHYRSEQAIEAETAAGPIWERVTELSDGRRVCGPYWDTGEPGNDPVPWILLASGGLCVLAIIGAAMFRVGAKSGGTTSTSAVAQSRPPTLATTDTESDQTVSELLTRKSKFKGKVHLPSVLGGSSSGDVGGSGESDMTSMGTIASLTSEAAGDFGMV